MDSLSDRNPRPRRIQVAVDPVALVVTECITVTSAMRKHARWAHSSVSAILGGASPSRLEARASKDKPDVKGPSRGRGLSVAEDAPLASRWGLRGKKGQSMQDNPLLAAFARLRSDLKQCKGLSCLRYYSDSKADNFKTYIPLTRLPSSILSSRSSDPPRRPLQSPPSP